MTIPNESIDKTIQSLKNLKALDLNNQDLSKLNIDKLNDIHGKIKSVLQLTSDLQKKISPDLKKVTSKRSTLLNAKGNRGKALSKAELTEKLAQQQKLLDQLLKGKADKSST